MLRRIARRAAITGGLEAARLLRGAGLMAGAGGRGAVFTLHHVRPFVPRAFAPNAHLEITPDFLDAALSRLKRDRYRFLALDAVPQALRSADPSPFAVFTLDDGYRNNLHHAAPVFRHHGVPFTVFVAGGFIDRTQTLWWETLAELLNEVDTLPFDFGTGAETLTARTLSEKQRAFDRIARFIHTAEETGAIARLNSTAAAHGIDALAITDSLTLDEEGLKVLAAIPGASLGAHTISHRALARLDDDEARLEMRQSADRVASITGTLPATIAYPYGNGSTVSARDHRLAAELGFTVAVTTQPGVVTEQSDLQALPRISLNGLFQKPAYVSALASGIPFRLMGSG